MTPAGCKKGARCGRPGCGKCVLIARDPRYDDTLVNSPTSRATASGPGEACSALGSPTGDTVGCRSCGGLTPLPVRECSRHGLTVLGNLAPASDTVRACRWCSDRPPAPAPGGPPLVAPLRLVPVGPDRLAARPDGYSFNAGLIRHRGRLLMAYRDGWAGSNVHVAELTEDYTVVRSTKINLSHPRAAGGREDPRLFTLGGRLHVAFIGVERAGQRIRTSQLYARLGDDLDVGEVFYPELAGRQEPMEKNWSMFDHNGELLAVYTTGPRHVVVRIDGDRAERVADTPVTLPWAGGVLRGGAPPVRVGDLYYHWFHGRTGADRKPHYNVGLSVFEAKPPFRVVAQSPRPMLWGSAADNAAETKPNYCVVAFPCGAILEAGVWRVSMGWNDRGVRVAEWDAATVDRAVGLG